MEEEELGGYSEWRRATGGTWEGGAGGAWRAGGRRWSPGRRGRNGPGEAGISGSWDDCVDDGWHGGSAGEDGEREAALWVAPPRSLRCPGR